MQEFEITVKDPAEFHARPAMELVKLASRFQSDINIIVEEKTMDAKSIIGILSLGIKRGTTIKLTAEGRDEEKAIQGLKERIEKNFKEN